MPALDARQLAVGGAAVVMLLLGAYTFWPSSPPPVTTTPVERARRSRAEKEAPTSVAAVRLKALENGRDEPGEGSRNPFRFQPKVAPAPPRPAVVTPPPASQIQRPAVPAGPPPLPPIPLKLIGVLERANGVKWAVLTDGKSAPLYGKDGDIIDGRYTIVKIGTESIEMTYADGRGRQVIRLTGS